jgi:hypothetical protein
MIIGAHTIIHASDADAVREFLRDKLKLPSVDAGGGWLIFALPPGELAAHPTEGETRHELYLMCDDIHATIAELEAGGVEFDGEVAEQRWGLTTEIKLPGGGRLPLYEPRHPTALPPPGD